MKSCKAGNGAAGRRLTAKDPTLVDDLRKLLEPATMGGPMRPSRCVSKSHAKLAAALCGMGHKVSALSLPKLPEQVSYRRHVNGKTKEGSSHPDRTAQFEHISAKARGCLAASQPLVSVNTKKKELLGEFKNPGSDYGPKGKPLEVDTHTLSASGNFSASPQGFVAEELSPIESPDAPTLCETA